jgi:hypothetical protein
MDTIYVNNECIIALEKTRFRSNFKAAARYVAVDA